MQTDRLSLGEWYVMGVLAVYFPPKGAWIKLWLPPPLNFLNTCLTDPGYNRWVGTVLLCATDVGLSVVLSVSGSIRQNGPIQGRQLQSW